MKKDIKEKLSIEDGKVVTDLPETNDSIDLYVFAIKHRGALGFGVDKNELIFDTLDLLKDSFNMNKYLLNLLKDKSKALTKDLEKEMLSHGFEASIYHCTTFKELLEFLPIRSYYGKVNIPSIAITPGKDIFAVYLWHDAEIMITRKGDKNFDTLVSCFENEIADRCSKKNLNEDELEDILRDIYDIYYGK